MCGSATPEKPHLLRQATNPLWLGMCVVLDNKYLL